MGLFKKKIKFKNIIPQKIDFYEMLINSGNHSLIAGTTGSGKSVLLNNCLNYMLCNYTPDKVQYIFFDPKVVELSRYKKIAQCLYYESDIKQINSIMRGLIETMNNRYKEMDKKNIQLYNGVKIIVVIDEIADLLTAYKEESVKFKKYLQILLAKSRAAKINFILCTQAPNRKIIPAEIVLNIPTRAALRCLSPIESRQIINESGAENLPKYGHCLLLSPDLTQIKEYCFGVNDPGEIIKRWTPGGDLLR